MLGGVTQEGLNLIAQSQASGNKLRFTHYALGSDMPTPLEDYTTFTSLGESKLELPILRANHLGGNKVLVVGNLEIGTLKDSFVYHELGVYAQIGDEPPKLHSYFWKVDGENMTPELLVERTLAVEVFVDRTTEVHLDINHSIEWLTRLEFLEHTETKTGNPHGVTKHDVDLGKVLNRGQYTIGQYELGEYTDDYLNALVGLHMMESKIKEHLGENNPHKITKQTVDLGFVQNYPVVDETTLENLSSEAYMTPFHTNLLYLNLLKKGQYLLQHFTDYDKLLTKEGLTGGPNIQVIDTPEGRKVTYTGSVQVGNPRWEDIQETNTFHTHPDVARTLKDFVTTLTSENKTIKITKVNGGYNLESTLSLNFEDIGGNPTDNLKLQGALSRLIEKVNLVGSDTVEKVVEGDTISFKVKPQILLSTPEFTQVLASKLTLTLEELDNKISSAVKVKEIRSANSNCVISTGADGVVTIDVKTQNGSGVSGGGDSGGSGSGSGPDLSNYYTKQEVDQRLESKLGLLEDYPQLATQNKTVIGAVAELDSRLDSAAVLIQNQDKEIEELKKVSLEGKLNVIASLQAKHPQTAVTESSTYMEICNGILNIPSGSGFVPPEYNELIFGFPFMTQPNGYTGLQWQIGGNIAIASMSNILFVLTRTHEFNFQCARMEFDSDIRVIQISIGGKYFVIGFTDKWGVYQSSDLTEIHSLTTFHTATPQFTHDEIHLAYWQDTQSLILYNLQSKTSRLVKGSANPIKFISNDLTYYHSNYVYNIQDGKSVQCQGTAPNQYFNDKMYYLSSDKLQRLTYTGTTQSVEDILTEGVTSTICSHTHMVIWNSTSKTLTWYNSNMDLHKSIQNCKALPNRLFGEYAMYDFTNNTFPRLYIGTDEIEFDETWEHNYSVDGKTFYVKSTVSGVNKVYRFQNKGQGFVLSGTLELENTINYVYCSPNGKNLAITSNSKLFLYTDMAFVREVNISKYIPFDDLTYLIGTNGTLMKWDGEKYLTVYSGYGVNLNRELTMSTLNNTRTIEIYKLTEKLRFDLPETCTYCNKNLMIGPFKTYVINTDTGDWTSRPTTIVQQTFNITDTSYFVLGEGYSYMEGSSVARINPYLKCTKAQGLTLFGTQHVTCLEQV